ncbi:flagellar assembly protein T N-terminal domain-containing protein [Corallincola platygyrae]|uniref:Flagellar assembly protein T N-terminal domain-containing protein n=1 Tax=Corallincola platygyrae TaxID=1193278 RepID=A0ABW4XHW4_9GAMM
MLRRLLILLLLLASPISHAMWYEAEGSATIYSGDIASARERATQQALKNALILAGGTVSSLQELAAGKIVNDQFQIRTSGTVRDVRVLSERRSGETLYISIHADLFPQSLQCESAAFKKSLLLTRFRLSDPTNARVGGIEQIGQEASQWLFDHLRAESQSSYPKRWLNQITHFTPAEFQSQRLVTPMLSREITRQTNTQVVLFAEIRDLSFNGEVPTRKWQEWVYSPPERNFELMIHLVDGSSGELLLERSYHSQAPWDFPTDKRVSVASKAFWTSPYGGAVSDVLSQLQADLDMTLSCTPGRGRITHIANDLVEVDLGHSNGLRIGDKLTLLHRMTYDGQDGKHHVRLLPTEVTLRVTESYQNRLIARASDPKELSGVQVNDIVQLGGVL